MQKPFLRLALKIDDGQIAEDVAAARHGLRRIVSVVFARYLLADVRRLSLPALAQHIVRRRFLPVDIPLDVEFIRHAALDVRRHRRILRDAFKRQAHLLLQFPVAQEHDIALEKEQPYREKADEQHDVNGKARQKLQQHVAALILQGRSAALPTRPARFLPHGSPPIVRHRDAPSFQGKVPALPLFRAMSRARSPDKRKDSPPAQKTSASK